jgi:hypothetical protein
MFWMRVCSRSGSDVCCSVGLHLRLVSQDTTMETYLNSEWVHCKSEGFVIWEVKDRATRIRLELNVNILCVSAVDFVLPTVQTTLTPNNCWSVDKILVHSRIRVPLHLRKPFCLPFLLPTAR